MPVMKSAVKSTAKAKPKDRSIVPAEVVNQDAVHPTEAVADSDVSIVALKTKMPPCLQNWIAGREQWSSEHSQGVIDLTRALTQNKNHDMAALFQSAPSKVDKREF